MTDNRTVLYLDLQNKSFQVKVHADTRDFLGGLGLALKLLADNRQLDPVIFAIGPLNRAFPFVSRICSLFYDQDGRLTESYGGGKLGLMLSFTSFEAVVIYGKNPKPLAVSFSSDKVEFLDRSKVDPSGILGLPGRSSRLELDQKAALIDGFFEFNPRLAQKLGSWNLRELVVNADRSFKIERTEEYLRLYQEILARGRDLSVPYGAANSCGGCPAGCDLSRRDQFEPYLVLPYCLVACSFAAKIFDDVPTVFACLQSLGQDCDHELLERIGPRVNQMRSDYARL